METNVNTMSRTMVFDKSKESYDINVFDEIKLTFWGSLEATKKFIKEYVFRHAESVELGFSGDVEIYSNGELLCWQTWYVESDEDGSFCYYDTWQN